MFQQEWQFDSHCRTHRCTDMAGKTRSIMAEEQGNDICNAVATLRSVNEYLDADP